MELSPKNAVVFSISYILLYLTSLAIPVYSNSGSKSVHLFKRSSSLDGEESSLSLNEYSRRVARDADVTETESERQDKSCEDQKAFFSDVREKLKNGTRLEETHVFLNETKYNLALAWAGENDAGILLVLTTKELDVFQNPESTLWRSKDHGRSWEDWSSHVDKKIFRKDDGLQRNPHNPSKVYLVSYEHFLYVTENGGESWTRTELTSDAETSLSVDEQLEFHPEPQFEDYVAVVSNDRKLYVTYNNFLTNAVIIKSGGVHTVRWGTAESKTEKCLYVTIGDFSNPLIQIGPQMMDLERYDSTTKTWKTILKRVVVFNVEDKFIYASIFKSENPKTQDEERLMMISSDGGETWGEAQLPTLTGDRFFSVLDMSEGLIFMHVDNPGDTGHGVLYTSSSSGLVYAESLKNHLFPNYNTVHDFYKVESMRGVYLASQMSDDKSIHTMITYNRGAEWRKVPRPIGVECQNDEKEGCYLQIHNSYSIHRGINAQPPHSQKKAYGLVLVHAHVASNLQTTPPDVFLSTDGGYNFRRVLKGPHAYEIADSGGLLVAVPLDTEYPNVVKFSTDEGHCWHTYKFTSDEIKFTGLLTEPGGKSMTFGIWGYQKGSKKWTVNVIDFNTIVTRECKEDDYVPWIAHTSLTTKPGFEGCLLGVKETFKRIKMDSWCRNGYYKNMDFTSDKCKCTEEDYECDYGFHRPDNSVKCVRQPEIKAEQIDICKGGHLEKLETIGYRLIPGDSCDAINGFHPVSDVTDLNIVCDTGDKHAIEQDMKVTIQHTGAGKIVVAVIGSIILVLVAAVGAFFMYKLVLLKKHKVVYRYSRLNHGDGDLESAVAHHENLFTESSDDEIEQKSPPIKQNGSAPVKGQAEVKSFHDDSDDDMLG